MKTNNLEDRVIDFSVLILVFLTNLKLDMLQIIMEIS